MLKPNSWVQLTVEARAEQKKLQPFYNELLSLECILFLGEITQDPEYGIFAFNHGKIIAGYKISDFEMCVCSVGERSNEK